MSSGSGSKDSSSSSKDSVPPSESASNKSESKSAQKEVRNSKDSQVREKGDNYDGYEDSGKILDISKLSYEQCISFKGMTPEERQNTLNSLAISPSESRSVAKMSIWEEITMMIVFGFGVPGAVITIPIIIIIIGYLTGSMMQTWGIAVALLAPLSFWPQKYHVSNKESWLAYLTLKYFSFKIVRGGRLPSKDLESPIILVAPPHGVFPFGNILTMIGYPTIMGYDFFGLAASAVFRTPMFRQCMTALGAENVGRENMTKLLNEKRTVGISTGGVAEIFETHNKNEVIVLSDRKALVKLALRTGADLVPCYLLGNTKLLSLWTGGKIGHSFLKDLSRKLGIALILFWGRLGLPIPYRVPILGVMGNRIRVTKIQEPSQEDIDRVHAILVKDMVELFDKYKGVYGWDSKELIIV